MTEPIVPNLPKRSVSDPGDDPTEPANKFKKSVNENMTTGFNIHKTLTNVNDLQTTLINYKRKHFTNDRPVPFRHIRPRLPDVSLDMSWYKRMKVKKDPFKRIEYERQIYEEIDGLTYMELSSGSYVFGSSTHETSD